MHNNVLNISSTSRKEKKIIKQSCYWLKRHYANYIQYEEGNRRRTLNANKIQIHSGISDLLKKNTVHI